MFRLQSVLLIALDVVKGPYIHCYAPVNPFDVPPQTHTNNNTNTSDGYTHKMYGRGGSNSNSNSNSNSAASPPHESCGSDRLNGFSDVFVPRSEFCRRVMYLFEAESGLFYLFYPEEIAGVHYQRKTLRYSLCFVFAVDHSLVTSNAMLTERLVRPYSVVLTSIVGELREAEELHGYMSRGLARTGTLSSFPTTTTAAAAAAVSAVSSVSSFRHIRGDMELLLDVNTTGHIQQRFDHLHGDNNNNNNHHHRNSNSNNNNNSGGGGVDGHSSTVCAPFTTSEDFLFPSAKGMTRVNVFLTPLQDPAALHWTPLEEMIETLYACLSRDEAALRVETHCIKDNSRLCIPHKEKLSSHHHHQEEEEEQEQKMSLEERIASVRLSEMHSFCVGRMAQPHPPPRYTLDEVPIPIAEYSPELFEWADLAVHDVFKAVDGQRTIANIVQILATGYEAVEEEVYKQDRLLSPLNNSQTLTSPLLVPCGSHSPNAQTISPSISTRTTTAVGSGGLGISVIVNESDTTQSPSLKYANSHRMSSPAVLSVTQGNETRIVSPLSIGSRSHTSPTPANTIPPTPITTTIAPTTTTTTNTNNNNNNNNNSGTGVMYVKGHNPLQTSFDRLTEDATSIYHEGQSQPWWGELERIVLEALQHLEVNNYVRIIHPCRFQSTYSTTKVLYQVICDRNHSARRILGHRMCLIEKRIWRLRDKQRREETKRPKRKGQQDIMYETNIELFESKNGFCQVQLPAALLKRGYAQEDDKNDTPHGEQHNSSVLIDTTLPPSSGCEQDFYSLLSSPTAPTTPPLPPPPPPLTTTVDDVCDNGKTPEENDMCTTVISEIEAETAAAAALCALGKFTNSTVANVQREMRHNPIWYNAFAGWKDECCKNLVEIALINGWLKETTGSACNRS